jgi:ketosteroid isomerase-like protein
MRDGTVESVTSALKHDVRHQAPQSNSPAERELVRRFVKAFQSGDVAALISLLAADVRLSMPPIPLEYHGRDAVARFYASVFKVTGRYVLVSTRANGQPAFGAYALRSGGGVRYGVGVLVLTLACDRICVLSCFDHDELASFGLPRSLPC